MRRFINIFYRSSVMKKYSDNVLSSADVLFLSAPTHTL